MKRLILLSLVLALGIVAAPALTAEEADYCPWIRDGRLNDDPERSCAAPVIIYAGEDFNGVEIAVVNPDSNVIETVLTVSQREIDAVGVSEEENLRIADTEAPYTGYPIILSRLTTGEFQVNAFYANLEGYVVVWDEDYVHYAFTYYPEGHPKYQPE